MRTLLSLVSIVALCLVPATADDDARVLAAINNLITEDR